MSQTAGADDRAAPAVVVWFGRPMPEFREQVILATPTPTLGGSVISSPFQFYSDGAEQLVLLVANSAPNMVVQLVLRWLNPDGTIQPFRHNVSVPDDRGVRLFYFKLDRGFLLNAQLRGLGTNQIGQTYAALWLIRGTSTANINFGVLLGGYVTNINTLGWPGSPIAASTEGNGATLLIVFGPFALGSEFVVNVPVNTRWAVQSVFARLLQGFASPSVFPVIRYDDGTGTIIALAPASGGTTAAAGGDFQWAKGYTLTAPPPASGTHVGSLPTETTLPSGAQIQSITFGGPLAADQYSAVRVAVQEWLSI